MCACIRLSSVELMLPRDEGLPVLPVSPCCWLLYFPCSTSPASDQCNICKGCKLGLNLTQLRGHYTILKHTGGAFTPRERVPSALPLEEPTSARDVKCEHVSSNMSSNYWERSFFGNPFNANLLLWQLMGRFVQIPRASVSVNSGRMTCRTWQLGRILIRCSGCQGSLTVLGGRTHYKL